MHSIDGFKNNCQGAMLTQAGNFVGQSDTNAKTGKTIAIATLHWTQLTLVSLLQCLSGISI